jgi:hypothetical protein
MNARLALATTFALALMGHASSSNADPAEEGVAAEPLPPVIVAIDFETIPNGAIPRVPGEADVPQTAPSEKPATGVKLKKVKNPFGKKKLPPGLLAKMGKTEIVELVPANPEIAAMYVPAVEQTDFEGESISRMACHRKEPQSPVRWETLTIGSDGNARLAIKDLWFDAESCTVGSGTTAEVVFKAIAWDGAKPWLFAMRDEKSVTFLMPRASDVSADAMVGPATTIRGGFTRVTLPIGRWGSSSLVANLPTIELKAPVPPPKSSGKGQAASVQSVPESSDQPVEIAVELVQTMSEKSPTLLVRRNQPEGDRSASLTVD